MAVVAETKQFQNCFKTVLKLLFQFHFNYADSLCFACVAELDAYSQFCGVM